MPAAEGVFLGVYKGPADAIQALGLPDQPAMQVQISKYLAKIRKSATLQHAVTLKRQREDEETVGMEGQTSPASAALEGDTNQNVTTPVADEYRNCGSDFFTYQVGHPSAPCSCGRGLCVHCMLADFVSLTSFEPCRRQWSRQQRRSRRASCRCARRRSSA